MHKKLSHQDEIQNTLISKVDLWRIVDNRFFLTKLCWTVVHVRDLLGANPADVRHRPRVSSGTSLLNTRMSQISYPRFS